jgi:hypothetical protein
VEELVPEIRDNRGPSIRGSLPERLRFLPDFLVLDPQSGAVHLTEVKFKRSVSEESLQSLMREVVHRRKYWPETYTVVMVAQPPQERGFHQDHIRVVPPSMGQELEAARPIALGAMGALATTAAGVRPLSGPSTTNRSRTR